MLVVNNYVEGDIIQLHISHSSSVTMYMAKADPVFFLGGGTTIRNGVTDW